MLLVLVALDVAYRIGILKFFFCVSVKHAFLPIGKFTQTVGGTILEHVNDTTCTHVVTTLAKVAAIRHLGVESQCKVLAEFGVQLGVDVGAAHAGVKDDTLVLALSDRDVVTGVLCTTAD